MRVHHPDGAGLHLADPPGRGAEQEHVAGLALDGPVLVDRADRGLVRLGHHPVVAQLGDGPAGGERRQPGPAPGPQLAVDLVAVQVGRAAAAPGADALGHQLDDLVEVLPRQAGERRRPGDQLEQAVLRPVLGRALGHHLLRHDVQRPVRHDDRVQPARPDPAQQGRALDQLVPCGRVQPPGGDPAEGVVGPADPLQERGEAARRADLADQLHRPDVDAQLQRGGGHQGPQVAGPQPGLDPLPPARRQAAVVRGHLVLAEPLAELVGHPLGHPPGVDEHQRGPALLHLGGDEVEDLGHLLGRGHGLELVVGQLQGEIQLAPVAGVDDRAPWRAIRRGRGRGPPRPAAGRWSRSGAGWRTGRPAAPARRPGGRAAPA